LTRADRRTHWPFAYGCPVIAHIALHHLLLGFHHLRYSERASEHAVVAGNAARLQRGMDDTILALLNCICGADLRAGRLVTVPTNVSCGRDALAALDEIEVDHRLSAMGLTFLTSLQTGTTANAARGIDIELVAVHYAPPLEGPL
jgi:hypothetical protein